MMVSVANLTIAFKVAMAFQSPNMDTDVGVPAWPNLTRSDESDFSKTHVSVPIDYANQYAVKPLLTQLASFIALADGWDGLGSLAPSEAAVNAAMNFTSTLHSSLRVPVISAGNDGEVNISWRDDSSFVDLSFYNASGGMLFARRGNEKIKARGIKKLSDVPSAAIHWLAGL